MTFTIKICHEQDQVIYYFRTKRNYNNATK